MSAHRVALASISHETRPTGRVRSPMRPARLESVSRRDRATRVQSGYRVKTSCRASERSTSFIVTDLRSKQSPLHTFRRIPTRRELECPRRLPGIALERDPVNLKCVGEGGRLMRNCQTGCQPWYQREKTRIAADRRRPVSDFLKKSSAKTQQSKQASGGSKVELAESINECDSSQVDTQQALSSGVPPRRPNCATSRHYIDIGGPSDRHGPAMRPSRDFVAWVHQSTA